DTVVLAGKGPEATLERGDETIDWDEIGEARRALAERRTGAGPATQRVRVAGAAPSRGRPAEPGRAAGRPRRRARAGRTATQRGRAGPRTLPRRAVPARQWGQLRGDARPAQGDVVTMERAPARTHRAVGVGTVRPRVPFLVLLLLAGVVLAAVGLGV